MITNPARLNEVRRLIREAEQEMERELDAVPDELSPLDRRDVVTEIGDRNREKTRRLRLEHQRLYLAAQRRA